VNVLGGTVGSLVRFDDVEIGFGLADEEVVAAIFGGEVERENIQIGFADDAGGRDADVFAETIIRKGETAFEVFAENEKGKRFDQRMMKGFGAAPFFLESERVGDGLFGVAGLAEFGLKLFERGMKHRGLGAGVGEGVFGRFAGADLGADKKENSKTQDQTDEGSDGGKIERDGALLGETSAEDGGRGKAEDEPDRTGAAAVTQEGSENPMDIVVRFQVVRGRKPL
jgi:hypothetical protein